MNSRTPTRPGPQPGAFDQAGPPLQDPRFESTCPNNPLPQRSAEKRNRGRRVKTFSEPPSGALVSDGPRRPDGATVFIGTKPTMTYVFQVVAQLNSGVGPVVVKARGNAISKAVDVAEVVRRRFLEGQVDVGPITIDTERLVNREGREANVSSIGITLVRTKSPVSPLPPQAPTNEGPA